MCRIHVLAVPPLVLAVPLLVLAVPLLVQDVPLLVLAVPLSCPGCAAFLSWLCRFLVLAAVLGFPDWNSGQPWAYSGDGVWEGEGRGGFSHNIRR